jgi:hypothetical protein
MTRSRKSSPARGVTVADARKFLLALKDVVAGKSYGMPSFLLNGRFLARFRDDDTVLALRIASIDDRDVLMQIDPRAFFFTDHYRDYPAVLIRLAEVPRTLFRDVVNQAWQYVGSLPPKRKRR